jgi:glycosyltransferase involved in cell wall biosynthesis
MRVLLVTYRVYIPGTGRESVGGGAISAYHLARTLVASGAELRTLSVAPSTGRVDGTHDGVRVTHLRLRRSLAPRWSTSLEWQYRIARRQILGHIREFRPEVVHVYSGQAMFGVAGAARQAGCPFVASVNSAYLLCATGQGTDRTGRDCLGCRGWHRFRAIMDRERAHSHGKLGAVGRWLLSYPRMLYLARSLHRAALVLPISHGLAQGLARLGYPPHRTRVVHDPITVPSHVDEREPSALGFPNDARVLMYAGRLVENKGVQNVLRVMPSLPGTVMLVLGQGAYESALRRQTAELGLTDRVRFLEFVPNETLGRYYAAADVVIMAGTVFEGLSRMLMEASAHGVPVIGTRIGGIPDVIEDGLNGFLLDGQEPGELRRKIEAILASPSLARRMGEHGRAKMTREFSTDACARALIEAYEWARDGRTGGDRDRSRE